jgi:hypothetical protein
MTKTENERLIEKTIESSDFLNGGLLNPEQQARFVTLVKRFATLLPLVRSVRMSQATMEIDKLYVGEPVTESVDENTATATPSKPKFSKVELEARKVKSSWNVATEALQSNLEQNDFETTAMNAMTARISTDLEMLAIRGDMAIPAALMDPVSRLLRRLDGWAKQTEGAHVLDVAGAEIQKGIFAEMKRMLPQQYKNDPNLRWFVADTIADDWLDVLSGRETALGDNALQGQGIAPLGIPLVKIPLIPDDLLVPVKAGPSGAAVIGMRFGPFLIVTGSNDTLSIKVNGGAAIAITLPAGTLDPVTVAKVINTAFGAAPAFAADEGDGQLKIATKTKGAASSIEVLAAGTANDTLGLSPGVVTGADAGGTVPEGSFIWLANPKNFIWGILDGTRIFTEFNKDYDRIESVVYNQVAARIENIDAIVMAKNVRRRTLVI